MSRTMVIIYRDRRVMSVLIIATCGIDGGAYTSMRRRGKLEDSWLVYLPPTFQG